MRQPAQLGGHLAQVEGPEVAGAEAVRGTHQLLERQVDGAHHDHDRAQAEGERAAEEKPEDGAALLRLALEFLLAAQRRLGLRVGEPLHVLGERGGRGARLLRRGARFIGPAEIGQREGAAIRDLDAGLHVGDPVEHDPVVVAERGELLVAALVGVGGVAVRQERQPEGIRRMGEVLVGRADLAVRGGNEPRAHLGNLEHRGELAAHQLVQRADRVDGEHGQGQHEHEQQSHARQDAAPQAPEHQSPPARSTAPFRTTVM